MEGWAEIVLAVVAVFGLWAGMAEFYARIERRFTKLETKMDLILQKHRL